MDTQSSNLHNNDIIMPNSEKEKEIRTSNNFLEADSMGQKLTVDDRLFKDYECQVIEEIARMMGTDTSKFIHDSMMIYVKGLLNNPEFLGSTNSERLTNMLTRS